MLAEFLVKEKAGMPLISVMKALTMPCSPVLCMHTCRNVALQKMYISKGYQPLRIVMETTAKEKGHNLYVMQSTMKTFFFLRHHLESLLLCEDYNLV